MTKGIILAGGYGTRLFPLTKGVSKQLLPVYDKPMIYYPLSVLMNAGIREILIISSKNHIDLFKNLLGDGYNFGIKLEYKIQNKPNGIAESFLIGEEFIGKDDVALILGDNIFHGNELKFLINKAFKNLELKFCTIFGMQVKKPNEFGVIDFNEDNSIKRIIEKPKSFISETVVTGLYFYTNQVVEFVKKLKPSKRGELEISDINNLFLAQNMLKLVKLTDKIKWIDTGNFGSLINASQFIQKIEIETKKKIGCIEEIAFNKGYIDKMKLKEIAESMQSSDYGKYLLKLSGK